MSDEADVDQTFRPLLEALKQIGVDPQAVDSAAEEAQRSGRSVRAVLINDQVVTEEQLTTAAAAAFGINTLDLVNYQPEPAALKRIPLPVVLRHRVLGLSMSDGEIVVGVTDPGDVVARRSGLGSAAALRQHLHTTIGLAPSTYRRTFRR